jgi:Tfp pilus assembly protein PilF
MSSGRDNVIAALNLARIGDIAGANRLLHRLSKRQEFAADASYGRGLLDLCINNVDSSAEHFRKAISVDPEHADAYYQLAKIADSLGNALAAEEYLRAAIGKKPGHVMASAALEEHLLCPQNS